MARAPDASLPTPAPLPMPAPPGIPTVSSLPEGAGLVATLGPAPTLLVALGLMSGGVSMGGRFTTGFGRMGFDFTVAVAGPPCRPAGCAGGRTITSRASMAL